MTISTRVLLLLLIIIGSLPALALIDDADAQAQVRVAEQALDQTRNPEERIRALLTLSSALARARDFGRYVEIYDDLLRALPDQAWLHANRSVGLGKLGRHAEALAAADRAIVLDPQSFHPRIVRASWLHRLGRFDEARQAVAQTLAPAEDDPARRLYETCLACYHADAEDRQALEPLLRRLVANPESAAFFRRDPVFDPYRHEAWFIAIVGATLAETGI